MGVAELGEQVKLGGPVELVGPAGPVGIAELIWAGCVP